MIRPFLLLIALLLPFVGRAELGSTNLSTVEAQFDAANKLCAQGRFADAAVAYEKLIASGSVAPALYFNLGNAYFKAGQIGRAIAAYRQAEELSPRDPDVRANLQFARNQVQGPKLSAGWWQRRLGTLSTNEWMSLSTAAVWLTLGLLIVCQIKPALKPDLRSWIWLAIATSLVIFAGAALAISQSATHKVAIVAVADASVRNGPFDESPPAFTAHNGAELRTLDHKDGWLQVTDGASHLGWVKQDAVVWTPRS